MLTISAERRRARGLIAGFCLIGLSAPAAAAGYELPQPSAAQLQSLCPGMAGNPLHFGMSEGAGETVRFVPDPVAFAGFEPAERTYTSWSDRLAAVTLRAVSLDVTAEQRWREGVEATLRASGWTRSDERELATPLDEGSLFVRQTKVGGAERRLLFEVATPGALMLRCGDMALLGLDRDEREGRLPPGAPRPPFDGAVPAPPLPQPGDCDRPELLAAIGRKDGVDDDAPAFMQFEAAARHSAGRARLADRLNRWLMWKLRQSGKVTEERVWEVVDQASPRDIAATERDFGTMLQSAGEAYRAHERGDARAMCLAFVPMVTSQVQADERRVQRLAAINAALDGEARRAGVSLD